MSKPIIVFRTDVYIGPRRRSPFFRVLVFRDAPSLRAFALAQSRLLRRPVGTCRPAYWRNVVGVSRYFRVGRAETGRYDRRRPDRQVGVVLLAATALGIGIVSHEFTHAAVQAVLGARFPARITVRSDERIATVQGSLLSQFTAAYYRRLRRTKGKR